MRKTQQIKDLALVHSQVVLGHAKSHLDNWFKRINRHNEMITRLKMGKPEITDIEMAERQNCASILTNEECGKYQETLNNIYAHFFIIRNYPIPISRPLKSAESVRKSCRYATMK